MAIFYPDSMGLRYIYFEDLCDDTNPMGPVGGRMVARIVAGGQKSEMGQNGFNGFFRRSGGRRQLLKTGGGTRQLGESTPISGQSGRWPAWRQLPSSLLRPREKRERRERDMGRREREK
ncbi:hypothetical protein PanWU01x14_358250 [Parasponia andersonii]|uniref:Uncharacterized protein n=1 Tax=Parasponia andersonii TaxID=3476 RepID=A0A2P5A8E2_PARAD|nr:hypothetical protein PanWU01x14_358250 [Parasponia andersonii]